MVVRKTVVVGAAAGGAVAVVVVVVVVIVVVVAVVELGDCVAVVLGTVPCVCADARAAAAKITMARDTFFTRVLNLGEI